MDTDTILVVVLLILIFAGAVGWKLYDDFKHETKGLRKLHSKKRRRD